MTSSIDRLTRARLTFGRAARWIDDDDGDDDDGRGICCSSWSERKSSLSLSLAHLSSFLQQPGIYLLPEGRPFPTLDDTHLNLVRQTATMSDAPAKQKAIFESITEYGESALDNGWIPDAVLRPVIRKLCRVRLGEIDKGE